MNHKRVTLKQAHPSQKRSSATRPGRFFVSEPGHQTDERAGTSGGETPAAAVTTGARAVTTAAHGAGR